SPADRLAITIVFPKTKRPAQPRDRARKVLIHHVRQHSIRRHGAIFNHCVSSWGQDSTEPWHRASLSQTRMTIKCPNFILQKNVGRRNSSSPRRRDLFLTTPLAQKRHRLIFTARKQFRVPQRRALHD